MGKQLQFSGLSALPPFVTRDLRIPATALPGSLGRRLQRLEESAGAGVLEEGAVAVVGRAPVTRDLAVDALPSVLVYHAVLWNLLTCSLFKAQHHYTVPHLMPYL